MARATGHPHRCTTSRTTLVWSAFRPTRCCGTAIGLMRSLYLKDLHVPEGVLRTGIDKRFRRRPRHRHRRDARSPRASASNSAGTPRATLAIKSTGPATGFHFGNGPSKSHAVYEVRVDPGEFIDHQRTPPPMGVSGAEPETVVCSQPIPLGEPGSGTGGTTKSGPASTAGTPAGAMTSRAGMFGHVGRNRSVPADPSPLHAIYSCLGHVYDSGEALGQTRGTSDVGRGPAQHRASATTCSYQHGDMTRPFCNR
jgi:hypothetical protein